MTLSAGTRLGSHEIVGLLGAGGMGEVYRALDSRLNRQVAIKILPEPYASDSERVGRFHREAQAVAALNHPNIAAIYQLEEAGDAKFLVLELVEGDTLADRIGRGPVPVDEALMIARQILEALESAHEKGICHRDLKPANVKAAPDGTVKVLDFGLAKFIATGPAAAVGNLTHSPTLTLAGTYPGLILGTAGYMSPEQAKGLEADQRSDIFSFGVILYELLTGRQAFEGETASEILASVLKIAVDFTALPPNLNPRLVDVLERCLEKNPKKRWHAAADVRLEIDALIGRAVVIDEPRAVAALSRRPLWKRSIPVVAALAVGSAAAGYVAWRLKPAPTRAVARFEVLLPEGQTFTNAGRPVLALSPDGTQLVYVANQRLYLRSMSALEAHPIIGSEGSAGVLNPVFSPDGQSIAFYTPADRAIKRITVTGGSAVMICPASAPYGMVWDEHGILFGQAGKGIVHVPPNGGAPDVVAAVGGSEVASAPQWLPDGRTLLYTVRKPSDPPDSAQIAAQPVGGQRRVLIDGGSSGRYLSTGHLVYVLQGVLLAVPFDARRLAVTGGAVPVVEGIRKANTTATAHFSDSATGTLVYVPGPAKPASIDGRDLALFDRKGGAQPLKLPPDAYVSPRVSPDGRFVAVGTQDDKDEIVWIYEIGGASARRRLTFGGKNRNPIWSPDGLWITFTSDREGDSGLFRQRADGSGAAERVTKADAGTILSAQAWTPEGSTLLLWVYKEQKFTLAALAMKDGRLTTFDDIRSTIPVEAVFSPDGRWLVYQSAGTPSGAARPTQSAGESISVYVEPFPRTGAKYLLPSPGGHPYWIRKTNELVVNVSPIKSTSVAIAATPAITFGQPADFARVGRAEANPATSRRNVDAMPDGEHVLGILLSPTNPEDQATGPQRIVVVTNWFDELRQRVTLKQ